MLRCLEFAGPTDRALCGDVPTGGLTALTVETWVRADVIRDGNRPLVAKWAAGAAEWALYLTRDGRVYLALQDAAGGVSAGYSGPGALAAGQWRHVAGVYDGTGQAVRVYVHGADVTEEADASGLAVANTAQAVQIGGYLVDEDYGFIGALGWGRVSNSVRYAGSYVIPWNPATVDGATLAQWSMAEGSGSTLDNAQGNPAYDGTIYGATWGVGPFGGVRGVGVRGRPATLNMRRRGRQ